MPWTLFETAIGPCGIAWSDAGITTLQLPEESEEATAKRLERRAASACASVRAAATPEWIAEVVARVRDHLSGRPQDLAQAPLDLARVSPFSARVYRALQSVPAGSTVSYGELAHMAGAPPGAARAVGRAMAENPVPLLVPCHRVLASGGKPGGFSAYGGLVTKDRLLALEGAPGLRPSVQASLFAPAAEGAALPYDAKAAALHLAAADAKLGRHIARVGPFALKTERLTASSSDDGIFGALAESIVYQQLSGKAAATIFARVRALYPGGRLDPVRVLGTADEALRGAGLSRGKLAALRDLADKAASGRIPTYVELARLSDEEIVERLTEVRGVGRWTVQMLLIFRLGRPDVLPLADYGIRKGFAKVFRARSKADDLPSADELTRRAERWRPFRSVASWYLWRALDA